MSPKATAHSSFLIAATALFVLRLIDPITLIPDSYDLAAQGECLWTNHSNWIDCNEATLGFRPIAPAILMGPFLLFTNGLQALNILCAISLLIFFYSLQHIVNRSSLSFAILLTLILSPSTRQLLSLIDARILVLGPLMWVYQSLLCTPKSIFRNIAIGLVVSTAALSRPEHLLSVVLVIFWMRGFHWSAILSRLAAIIPLFFVWIGYLSYAANQLVMTPRSWEGWILQHAELPLRWGQQMFGMGIWSPPLRTVAQTFPTPPSTQSLSVMDAFQWVHTVFAAPYFVALAVGMLIGAALLYREPQKRTFFIAFLALMLPTLMAAIYPQARDPYFTQSNLIPTLLALSVLGVTGYHQLLVNLFSPPVRYVFLGSVIAFLSLLAPDQIYLPQVHTTEAAIAYIRASQNQSSAKVLASFETAPILYYTSHDWQQLPSPFERRDKAQYLIYSHLDTLQLSPMPRIRDKTVSFEKAFIGSEDGSWVLLYRLEDTVH